MAKRIVDPYISDYPAAMNAAKARREARNAKMVNRQVPYGHPYRIAPNFFPYWLAKIFGRIDALVNKPKHKPKNNRRRGR